MVRPLQVCRSQRAWRMKKASFGTQEARSSPAALTARAKREGTPNDKEGGLMGQRESDRFIVAHGNFGRPEPKCAEGATGPRSPHRQPVR